MASKPQPKYERPEDMPVDDPERRWEGMLDGRQRRWEDIVVGEERGEPVEWRIKPSTHQKHCDYLDIHLPFFEVWSNLFPWELAGWARVPSRYRGRIKINEVIQSGFRYEFFQPAKGGQPIFSTGTTLDQYVKREKNFLMGQTETREDKGQLLLRVINESVNMVDRKEKLNWGATGRQREESWKEMGDLVKASTDLPIGFVLLTTHRGPLPMRVSGFAQGGWSKELWKDNIHVDAYAERMGYRGGVVEGPITWEYGILDTLVKFFGPESFFTSGVVDVKVCGPGYLGDVLVGKARVKEKIPEDGGVRLVLETRIEKLDGFLSVVGTASALVK